MNITGLNTLPVGRVGDSYRADLSVTGGIEPYVWTSPDIPAWLTLDRDQGTITGTPNQAGTSNFTVQVVDHQNETCTAHSFITVNGKERWQLPAFITHMGNWLALYALALPFLGYLPIVAFTLASPGSRWTHLAVGSLTSLTAFIIGCFVGFLFATPRVVSSGQLKAAGVSLGSNLAEVSDWLTKLLLGAGLVQLTHLGAPIGSLIDHVAIGLQNPSVTGGPTPSAEVMAGLIIFGYAVLGLLEGYVVTSVWYPKKLIDLAGAINKLP